MGSGKSDIETIVLDLLTPEQKQALREVLLASLKATRGFPLGSPYYGPFFSSYTPRPWAIGELEGRKVCAVDEDCPPGYKCRNGYCVQWQKTSCTTDADCPEGQQCINGKCIERKTECSTDEDCPPEHKCVNGVCIKLLPQPDECQTDADCPPDERCVMGRCQPRPRPGPNGDRGGAEAESQPYTAPATFASIDNFMGRTTAESPNLFSTPGATAPSLDQLLLRAIKWGNYLGEPRVFGPPRISAPIFPVPIPPEEF